MVGKGQDGDDAARLRARFHIFFSKWSSINGHTLWSSSNLGPKIEFLLSMSTIKFLTLFEVLHHCAMTR